MIHTALDQHDSGQLMSNIRLRIELIDTDPLVWREFVVPRQINLRTLHRVIQHVMGWEEAHLYEFECDGRHYGEPDPDFISDRPVAMASNAKLSTLLPKIERHELRYRYDFGDGWEHRLMVLETSLEGVEQTPMLLASEMACPPEDIGGVERSVRDRWCRKHRRQRSVHRQTS